MSDQLIEIFIQVNLFLAHSFPSMGHKSNYVRQHILTGTRYVPMNQCTYCQDGTPSGVNETVVPSVWGF
jgi:hypothetical protein